MSQAGRTRYFARSATRARSARRGKEKNKALSGGTLAAGWEKEGELATASLEFEYIQESLLAGYSDCNWSYSFLSLRLSVKRI